jgi:cyclopropane fatty-acyl-phospholipid synthase-like methyltransferase
VKCGVRVSYNDMFKYSDVLNPISSKNLFLVGKAAKLNPKKRILDLGCGKGYPSLLWASVFGASVEGFDVNKGFVNYANSRAKLLNLGDTVRYVCRDIREQSFPDKYDVVSSLGLGVVEVYGAVDSAVKHFRRILKKCGFLILAEPVWLVKPVPKQVQEALETPQEKLCTRSEMEHFLSDLGFEVKDSLTSSKEDWERYIRPVNVAMVELMKSRPEIASECQKVMNGFKAEYQAAGKYWDMVMWGLELVKRL